MKENNYDNPAFFEQYVRFPRSVQGLSAAGEWHELERLLPGFSGKRVLDLGCGFGWHCRYASDHGAAAVIGVDLSEKMLEKAKADTHDESIHYVRAAMEDVDFPPASFEVVLSSLALHYVEELEPLVGRIYDWLTPGGDFVFSCEHPVFTAEGSQEWVTRRTARFLGCDVIKYHRTLTTYVQTLLSAGFVLRALVEPRPDPRLMDVPGMADELRRPMMLILAARKPGPPGC